MRRLLIIIAAIGGVLGAVIAVSAVVLFNTGAGRNVIKTQIEKSLGADLRSDVEIISMTGAPPSRIILNDMTFSGPDGRWLGVKRVELNWRPFAYLGKEIDIDELIIDGAHLYRRPPKIDEAEDEDEPFLIRLAGDLPFVRISKLTLSNISTDINGEIERISGAGAVNIGGRRIKADLVLASTNDRDMINVTVDLDPGQDRMTIDAALNARAEGAIVALAGLDSGFSFTATNDSPLSELDANFSAKFGDYGAVNGTLANDPSAPGGVAVDLSVSPGSAFADIPELTGPITTKLRIAGRDRGGVLTIDTMTIAAGEISGELNWQDANDIVDQLDVALTAVLATDYRPELQKLSGSKLTLAGRLDRKGDQYGIAAALTGEHASFAIARGETDLRNKLTGDISLAFTPTTSFTETNAPAFDLTAQMDADFDKELKFDSLSITTEDDATAFGAARYLRHENSISLTADIAATPATIARFAPALRVNGDITADIELSGPLERLTLKSLMETPGIQSGDTALPPLMIDIALAGLPTLPTGDITARATGKNQPGAFTAQLRSSSNGRVVVPLLDYKGKGFRLAGDASYHHSEGIGTIKLNYEGDENAAPWPGLPLMGDVQIEGAVSPTENHLTVTSEILHIGNVATRALYLKADGPLNALDIAFGSKVIAMAATGPINQVKAAASVDLEGAPVINLTALEGVIGGSRAHLSAPAAISFGDGVAINNLRLADGGNGAVAIDGAFSAARWQAKMILRDVNIPHADGTISLDLTLDTDAPIAANGNFQLRSLLTAGKKAALGGDFTWDRRSFRVTDSDDADTIDMEIRLPALLTKSPDIAINTTGAIDGYFRYDGDIGAMTPYLPPTLQTLEGALKADFVFGGTAAAPELSGEAEFSDGEFTEFQSGFSLTGLHVEATARHEGQNSTLQFTGGGRGAGPSQTDTVTLSGDLSLGENSLLDLAVVLKDAELSAAPVTGARLNGTIYISGSLAEISAAGEITVEELNAEIITPESTGLVDIAVIAYDSDGQLDTIAAPAGQVLTNFDITIAADDRIFIRGRGLESEWSADANVVNSRNGPVIIGEMNLRRGALDFSGRRFDLVRGGITFDRIPANNPRLDIRAEFETSDGVIAIIAVSGRADEPKVELQSTPAMPSENVMALVLFGKPAEELSAVESLQTAQALAALGGVGPFGREGITGTLRQAVGLDLLNFDLDPENGGGSLTVGKYVADGFFVSATQDAQGQAGSVRVEYEVIDNLTVETEIEQDGDQTVSANWKFDF